VERAMLIGSYLLVIIELVNAVETVVDRIAAAP
jgi:diacylglycerol kinase